MKTKTKLEKTFRKHIYLWPIPFAIPTYIFAFVCNWLFGENQFNFFPVITCAFLGMTIIGIILYNLGVRGDVK